MMKLGMFLRVVHKTQSKVALGSTVPTPNVVVMRT